MFTDNECLRRIRSHGTTYGTICLQGKERTYHHGQYTKYSIPNRHIDIKIAHGSRDHVIVPDIVKIMLSPDIESTDKTCSIVKNVDRALVKKKVLMIGSKEIDTISNSDIYDTYKNLYLSEKKREEKLLQGIQTANGLKARTGAKKTDDMALAVTTRKMRSKRRLVKCLQYL